MSHDADIAIIGAGIAGASLAAEVAGEASVLLLEAEDQPGYHSTGRSAAFWAESYGGPFVQPLTTASGPFSRPAARAPRRPPLPTPTALPRSARSGRIRGRSPSSGSTARPSSPDFPAFAGLVAGLLEPSCADIDVAGLHAFLVGRRVVGARLVTGAEVSALRRDGPAGRWRRRRSFERGSRRRPALADRVAAIAGAAPRSPAFRRTLPSCASTRRPRRICRW